jgi:hypothetical protein
VGGSSINDLTTTEISLECVNGITFIKEQLDELQKTLPFLSYDMVWKRCASAIDILLMDEILPSFIKQFTHDAEAFYALFRPWTKNPESYFVK